jgi:lipoprotein-releasing system ATP-binding protein
LLKLEHISKSYQFPSSGAELPVLRDLNLKLSGNDRLAVTGPSGSGKSTLLNIIGTLDRPSSGKISFKGRDLLTMPAEELSGFRNREIGFVFQLHHLLPQCTVLENVLIPCLPFKKHRQARQKMPSSEKRALTLLGRVGLIRHIHHRPGELSGGERQRVALVRALINKPALLLADEPTGSLDAAAALELIKLLLDLNREEKTALLIVTHAQELAKLMDKVFLLKNGKLKAIKD